ncbi:hypothetical protein MNBD_IGNAVI01-1546 [hydrothermal vent metagenome]|uniref:Response regulatory domain-containing protein n=1 Tax=hydrothermal vent metagenome TaxID=652676 RepID=A0A3B1BUQ5_9ZZZZ
MIKILLISLDNTIKLFIERKFKKPEYQSIIFNETSDPLDIISQVCKINPAILIIDDDFINPNSLHLLKSTKNIKPNLSIVFITSNSSLELGREINRIGVKYYLIKPISEIEFYEYVKSICINSKSHTYK